MTTLILNIETEEQLNLAKDFAKANKIEAKIFEEDPVDSNDLKLILKTRDEEKISLEEYLSNEN